MTREEKHKLIEQALDIKSLSYIELSERCCFDYVQAFAENVLKTIDSNYIINKEAFNNNLEIVKAPYKDEFRNGYIFTTGIKLNVFLDERVKDAPDKLIKDYIYGSFAQYFETLDKNNLNKIVKKRSDLDSEEKKMIKFIKKEMGIKSFDKLKKWYEDYREDQKRQMEESLNRYYNGKFRY